MTSFLAIGSRSRSGECCVCVSCVCCVAGASDFPPHLRFTNLLSSFTPLRSLAASGSSPPSSLGVDRLRVWRGEHRFLSPPPLICAVDGVRALRLIRALYANNVDLRSRIGSWGRQPHGCANAGTSMNETHEWVEEISAHSLRPNTIRHCAVRSASGLEPYRYFITRRSRLPHATCDGGDAV